MGGAGNSYKLTCFKHFQYFRIFALDLLDVHVFNEFLF